MQKKRTIIIGILLFFSHLNAFKINRSIISWDNNYNFDFFWPIVAKAWYKIGIKPTLIFIGTKKKNLDRTFGEVFYFEPILSIPTSFQAMVIRPLIASLFTDDFCILSDLDMIPLNKKYFENSVAPIPSNNFAVFYPKFYKYPGRYMMCYNAARGSTFAEIFDIKNIYDIKIKIVEWYREFYNLYKFTTDERMLYKYLNEWKFKKNRLSLLNMRLQRLNRENWHYKIKSIINKKYADIHLPKPYIKNKEEINKLLEYMEI